MKKFFFLAIVSAIIFSSCSGDSGKTGSAKDSTTTTTSGSDQPTISAGKKYDVKSGIVTLETTMDLGGMNIVEKKIVYFDDYGIKEAAETFNDDGTLKETTFSDGKDIILLIHANKEAWNRGKAYQGTEMRYDREGVEAVGKAKKVANINVAGKDCDAYEFKDENTKTTNTFAGYKHILVYMKQDGAMNSITKATKIEEDVPVPAEKFTVPAGYTSKKM